MWRSRARVERWIMRPLCATEMVPVSSETTTATASLTSVMPSAARWRRPICRSVTVSPEVSGMTQAAATMREPLRITAPSCSGRVGIEDLHQQFDRHGRIKPHAAVGVVFEAHLPLDDNQAAVAALATGARPRLGERVDDRLRISASRELKFSTVPARPRRSSARRISGAKMTGMEMISAGRVLRSSQEKARSRRNDGEQHTRTAPER